MTANQNHANLNVFVYGEQDIDRSFHPSDNDPRGGYGVLGIPGQVCDLTLFIHTPEQARAIAAAAAEIAAQFPGAEPEPAHECGTPAEGIPDLNTYPARTFVLQRDPADPESWVFRCGEGHGLNEMTSIGWQSPDYATEGGALIAAADHARGVHDMALPAELAARAAAAEQAAARVITRDDAEYHAMPTAHDSR
jgi:hypothetical protein